MTLTLTMPEAAIPVRIVQAFGESSTLSPIKLAPLLGMTSAQLLGLVKSGSFPAHVKGTGSVRTHYVFTLHDVRMFLTPPAPMDDIFEAVGPVPAAEISTRARPRNRKTNRPAKPRQPGYVYFVSDGTFVKIGWASNWKRRVAVVQGTNPNDLKVLAVCKGSTFHERALHRKFEKHHARGEWHRLDQEILNYIDDLGRRRLNCVEEE